MTKRIFALLAICFWLIPAVVYADVIVTPDNNFFSRYQNECIYLGRSFVVNSTEGFAAIKTEPGADSGHEIKNGTILHIEYSCLYKGAFWGLASFFPGESFDRPKAYGWIEINEHLPVLYDYVAFEEEHWNELYAYKGDYAEIQKTAAAIAWPWPGADAPLWVAEDLDTESFKVRYAYTDAQGREWGFATHLYVSPNVWFCLSDPLNHDIPAFNPTPPPMAWESETPHTDIGKTGQSALGIVIVLVAALAAGTAILIKILWKPNKQDGRVLQ